MSIPMNDSEKYTIPCLSCTKYKGLLDIDSPLIECRLAWFFTERNLTLCSIMKDFIIEQVPEAKDIDFMISVQIWNCSSKKELVQEVGYSKITRRTNKHTEMSRDEVQKLIETLSKML